MRYSLELITATAVLIEHPFEVVTQTEVADSIHAGDVDPLFCHSIYCAADAKTWGHLKVGSSPRVLCGDLILAPIPHVVGLGLVPGLWLGLQKSLTILMRAVRQVLGA